MHPSVPTDPTDRPLIEFKAPQTNPNPRAKGPSPLESSHRHPEAPDVTPARTRPRIQDSPLLASALKSTKPPASRSSVGRKTASSLLLNDLKPSTTSRSRHSVSFADDTANQPASLHAMNRPQKSTGEIH